MERTSIQETLPLPGILGATCTMTTFLEDGVPVYASIWADQIIVTPLILDPEDPTRYRIGDRNLFN